MTSQPIIDSHIHLWPAETANEEGHVWMTPGMPLAKPHLLQDYHLASSNTPSDSHFPTQVTGVVYIETDVRYDAPSSSDDVATWARGPLDEILFCRRIVEGQHGAQDSRTLLGIVPWAPVDQPTSTLEEYLTLAKDMAGPQAWPRVKGFRFLLQAIPERERFERLVFSDAFVDNLKLLGRRGFSFDVGVDQHSAGIWQLEAMAAAMERAHRDVPEEEKVVFVVNHLCKPDFAAYPHGFEPWAAAVEKMAKLSRTYMKLSGAFSELPPGLSFTETIVDSIAKWVRHVFAVFGAQRVMFGSDWPVCNVSGPKGEASWPVWKDVVHLLMTGNMALNDREQRSVWYRTAAEAYRLT